MVTMKATDARNNIGSLWDEATEQPVLIESAGKPIAVGLSVEEYSRLATARPPRQFGCGRHLLSEAGVNVNDLLATPIDYVFSGHMPVDRIIAATTLTMGGLLLSADTIFDAYGVPRTWSEN